MSQTFTIFLLGMATGVVLSRPDWIMGKIVPSLKALWSKLRKK
jgi:hypothetical protein